MSNVGGFMLVLSGERRSPATLSVYSMGGPPGEEGSRHCAKRRVGVAHVVSTQNRKQCGLHSFYPRLGMHVKRFDGLLVFFKFQTRNVGARIDAGERFRWRERERERERGRDREKIRRASARGIIFRDFA